MQKETCTVGNYSLKFVYSAAFSLQHIRSGCYVWGGKNPNPTQDNLPRKNYYSHFMQKDFANFKLFSGRVSPSLALASSATAFISQPFLVNIKEKKVWHCCVPFAVTLKKDENLLEVWDFPRGLSLPIHFQELGRITGCLTKMFEALQATWSFFFTSKLI